MWPWVSHLISEVQLSGKKKGITHTLWHLLRELKDIIDVKLKLLMLNWVRKISFTLWDNKKQEQINKKHHMFHSNRFLCGAFPASSFLSPRAMLFTLASLLPLGIPPSSVSLITVYGSMVYGNETCLICFRIPSTYHKQLSGAQQMSF